MEAGRRMQTSQRDWKICRSNGKDRIFFDQPQPWVQIACIFCDKFILQLDLMDNDWVSLMDIDWVTQAFTRQGDFSGQCNDSNDDHQEPTPAVTQSHHLNIWTQNSGLANTVLSPAYQPALIYRPNVAINRSQNRWNAFESCTTCTFIRICATLIEPWKASLWLITFQLLTRLRCLCCAKLVCHHHLRDTVTH